MRLLLSGNKLLWFLIIILITVLNCRKIGELPNTFENLIVFVYREPVLGPRAVWKYELYFVNPDTKKITRITYDNFIDESPRWSPDGTKLAYVSRRATGRRKGDFFTNPLVAVILDLKKKEVLSIFKKINKKIDSLDKYLNPPRGENFRFYLYEAENDQISWLDTCTVGFISQAPFGYMPYIPMLYDYCRDNLIITYLPKSKIDFNLEEPFWLNKGKYIAVMVLKKYWITNREKDNYLVLVDSTGVVDTLLYMKKGIYNIKSFIKDSTIYFCTEKKVNEEYILYKYNWATNELEKILNLGPTYDYAISPDRSKIAYVKRTKWLERSVYLQEIFIRDLRTNNEEQITFLNGFVSDLDWSPK